MAIPLREKRFYEFGPFRLDASIPVLVRNGDIVALTPKALDTLLVLLQNAGNVVDKETLIQAVWPSAFVEESNLAQQISALRKALGDGEGAAVHIETVPKRGYRLTGKVMAVQEGAATGEPPPLNASPPNGRDPEAHAGAPPESGPAPPRQRRLALVGVAAAGLVALGFALRFDWPSTPEVPRWKQRQLTANTGQDPVLRSAISPDGRYLAYSDRAGIHVLVIETGESRLLRSPDNVCFR